MGFPDLQPLTEFCLHGETAFADYSMETQSLFRCLRTCKFANSASANATSKTCRRYGSYVLQKPTKLMLLLDISPSLLDHVPAALSSLAFS